MAETAWRLEQETKPVLREIHDTDLPELQNLLATVERDDPFARCAAYYAMTGRNGLWLYGDGKTHMVVARHPNRADRILLFPPFGDDPPGLVEKALSDPSLPRGHKEISRLGENDAYLALRLRGMGASEPQTEEVLDWTYPMHVISTHKVIEREGGVFNSFRGHINRALRQGLTAIPIDANRHAEAILDVVAAWAQDGNKDGYSFSDLTTPTREVLSLMKENLLPVGGVIVFNQEKPVGFWMWDEADGKHKTAMSLVRVSIGAKGAAEFGALKMCEILQSRGFDYMCLGGSETESLDRFKRKLCPVRSIALQTARFPKNSVKKQRHPFVAARQLTRHSAETWYGQR